MASRLTWCLAVCACLAAVAVASPLALGKGGPPGIVVSANTPGNAAAGKIVFVAFCGKCHTFAAAGSHGTLGPNLDQDRVSFTEVVSAIEEGVGGIQAEYVLRDITFTQVYNVAKFVTTERKGQLIGGSQGNP